MGNVRSVSDYERFAGINFKDQLVSVHTLNGKHAPTPHTQNYVCGKTAESSDIKTITKSISIDSNVLLNDEVNYTKIEIYDVENKLMLTQTFDRKLISFIGKNTNPISISINFETIVETSYYCKLYTFDIFDRNIYTSEFTV